MKYLNYILLTLVGLLLLSDLANAAPAGDLTLQNRASLSSRTGYNLTLATQDNANKIDFVVAGTSKGYVDTNGLVLGTNVALTATDSVLSPNTSDAADNKSLTIAGGGGTSITRGGRVAVFGNEYASTGGAVNLVGGAVSTGAITLQTQNSSANIDIQQNALSRWVFGSGSLTNDATNGGDLVFSKSGTTVSIQEGTPASACMGLATPNGNTNVVVTTTCGGGSTARVLFSRAGAVTNMGVISLTASPNGTNFSFASTGASDTLASSVLWVIVKEAA